MPPEPIVVVVDRNVEDLVPLFLAQRKADQSAMVTAIACSDFVALRKVGHGMAGSGASYGFDALTELGERIVEAARAADLPALAQLKSQFDDYMTRLVVKFV